MQGASVLVQYVGPYSYDELNYCDRLHSLITFIYIITPLLTFTHKPVLARASSSCYNSANVPLVTLLVRHAYGPWVRMHDAPIA